MSKLLLASEVTTELDFGESTTVRIGNSRIKLKGKYYRADSQKMLRLEEFAKKAKDECEQVGFLCDIAALEKYPHDAGRDIKARVTTLVNRVKDMQQTMATLGEKIREKDTTITHLQGNIKYLKKELRARMILMRDALMKTAMLEFDKLTEHSEVC
jgi:uncharacterized coiled-coil protein SlyX